MAKKEETELAVQGSTAVANLPDEILDGVISTRAGNEDEQMPRWQPNLPKLRETEQRLDPTLFTNTATGEQVDRLRVVILKVQFARMFAPYIDGERIWVCSSVDRVTGELFEGASDVWLDRRGSEPTRKCEGCLAAAWNTLDSAGKKQKAQCRTIFKLIVFPYEHGQVATMGIGGESYGAFKTWLNKYHFRRGKKGADAPVRIWNTTFTLAPGENGPYVNIVPDIAGTTLLPKESEGPVPTLVQAKGMAEYVADVVLPIGPLSSGGGNNATNATDHADDLDWVKGD